MSDDLTVYGGGRVKVSTEEISSDAAQLRDFASVAGGTSFHLAFLDRTLSDRVLVAADAPISAATASQALDDCDAMLRSVRAQAEGIAGALDATANVYGAAEQMSRELMRLAAGEVARRLGGAYPFLLAWLTPTALGAAATWAVTPEHGREALLDLVAQNPRVLNDSRLVDIVRLAVSSVDEFGSGALQLRRDVHWLLSDVLGVVGLSTSAVVVTNALRGVGLARETPVTVVRTKHSTLVEAPAGLAEQAKRIPSSNSQITIERYEVPEGPDRFVVYVGGTKEGGLHPGSEPFDMTSNLAGMGESSPFSRDSAAVTRAVELALKEAGVTPENPIQIAGYSQGAMAALNIANSSDFAVHSVFTVGGPTGELPIPDDVLYLALEHEEDIVTALGGVHRDPDTIVVRRSLFGDGDIPTTSVLPAHELARYQETAALLDDAKEDRVASFVDQTRDFTKGAVGVSSERYLARRKED
ncbi:hypothetical protein FVA74_00160 [Salinibacterium sp. dk2585]|uniref:hypothetical protein n=1 Tax=unclassified Salinibacterium TaxID=2632331 RepID=UPI0011C24F06|nr:MULTISPECIES: hypothetical protein [unclassified Salinibacterium]QEE60144.1 hypothetical protein FVA74_00160 [Salinibacterium sp. dk2585]TXK55216.1 hypothetical protein FVP63_00305 [Salinibacterium sp. dk5596]